MQPLDLKERLKTLAADVFNAVGAAGKARAEVALDNALRDAYAGGQLMTTAENLRLVNTAHIIGLYAAKQEVEADLKARSSDMRQKHGDFNRGARDALRQLRFKLDQMIAAKAALVDVEPPSSSQSPSGQSPSGQSPSGQSPAQGSGHGNAA